MSETNGKAEETPEFLMEYLLKKKIRTDEDYHDLGLVFDENE